MYTLHIGETNLKYTILSNIKSTYLPLVQYPIDIYHINIISLEYFEKYLQVNENIENHKNDVIL